MYASVRRFTNMAFSQGSQSSPTEIPTFYAKSPINRPTTSYSSVTQNLVPKRDQGIVMDCVGDLTLTDYACAIGEKVQPKNVLFASRISNNRVCIYLATKELVEQLTDKYQYVVINQLKVTLRPLLSKLKRVIFSNVSPDIPNHILEDVLDQLKVSRGSPISHIKASITKEGYSHVGSFRRQVYAKPEEITKIPETFKINLNDINYFIYASTDIIRCFTCKLEGHLAANCKNLENSQLINNPISTPNPYPEPASGKLQQENSTVTASLSLDTIIQNQNNSPIHALNTIELTNKRTHSDISSTDSHRGNQILNPKRKTTPFNTKETILNPDISFSQPTNSQTSLSQPPSQPSNPTKSQDDMDRKLISLKNYLDTANTLLNYIQFKSLMENLKGSQNPIDIVKQYTQDLEKFNDFINEDIYPNVRDSSIKRKCTLLLKKIRNPSTNNSPMQTPVNSDNES